MTGSGVDGGLVGDVVRELDRVADRLRVLGPRLATRGEESAQVVDGVRAVLTRLADLTAEAEHHPRYAVPQLAPYALADQVLVLGHDLVATGDVAALGRARELLTALRHSL